MPKNKLTRIERAMLKFLKEYGDASQEDVAVGTLLFLHGMKYMGGGWEAAIAAIRERITLMDLLRNNGSIGQACIKGGVNGHLPELCLKEEREFQVWEQRSRAKETSAGEAYPVVKRVAQWAWSKTYGEDWNTGRMMQLRVDAWIGWTNEIYG